VFINIINNNIYKKKHKYLFLLIFADVFELSEDRNTPLLFFSICNLGYKNVKKYYYIILSIYYNKNNNIFLQKKHYL